MHVKYIGGGDPEGGFARMVPLENGGLFVAFIYLAFIGVGRQWAVVTALGHGSHLLKSFQQDRLFFHGYVFHLSWWYELESN